MLLNFGSHWLPGLFAGLLAGFVAAVFFCSAPESVRGARSTDYVEYYRPVADSILSGRGLTLPNGAPATRYPPGYSLTLAATYSLADLIGCDRESAVNAASSIWFVLGAICLWRLGSPIWGRWPALVPSILWCTYLPAISMLGQAGSELPFVPLLFAVVGLFRNTARKPTVGWALMFLVGIGCAGLMLIRPIALGLTCAFGGFLLLQRNVTVRARLSAIAALALGAGIGIGPWEAWLHDQCGGIKILSTNGPASVYDGLTFAVRDSAQLDRSSIDLPAEVIELQRDLDEDWRSGRAVTVGGLLSALARHSAERPLAVVELTAIKAARCWYGTDSRRHEQFLLLLGLPYALTFLVAAVRAIRAGGDVRMFALLVITVVFFNWAMVILVLSILRYMVPAIGLMLAVTPGLLSGRNMHLTSTNGS